MAGSGQAATLGAEGSALTVLLALMALTGATLVGAMEANPDWRPSKREWEEVETVLSRVLFMGRRESVAELFV